ncbi:nucleotidyltransferase family protein [Candidatus Woesearchaeota archaeon]|nr:nucleotidyltransferase family protein [Candidatus Woesearchaeota archaeon]
MKAIILAGGLGTRLRPLTDETPKPLLPIKGIPIIEHAINNFKKHNIKVIILSVGYKADKIKEYFGDGSKLGVNISYCIEDEPLGTGGAIKKAAENINETFIAINGDNLADFNWTEIINAHKKNNAKITLGLFPVEDVTKFGIARLEGDKLIEFIEKPTVEEAPSNLNNAGAYVMEPDVLNILPEGKSSIERDCFEKLSPKGIVYAYKHNSQWFPTDTLEKYEKADNEFNTVQ